MVRFSLVAVLLLFMIPLAHSPDPPAGGAAVQSGEESSEEDHCEDGTSPLCTGIRTMVVYETPPNSDPLHVCVHCAENYESSTTDEEAPMPCEAAECAAFGASPGCNGVGDDSWTDEVQGNLHVCTPCAIYLKQREELLNNQLRCDLCPHEGPAWVFSE